MIFSEQDIATLREQVRPRMGERRYAHTLGVEQTACRLASLFPGLDESEMAAAALLHDITKELPETEQRRLLAEAGVSLTPEEDAAPAVFHSFTAPYVIRRDFPAYATETVLGAVRKHTAGAGDMSLFDKILFIADYTEQTRTYPKCVSTRNFLFSGIEALSPSGRERRLNGAIIRSVDYTLAALTERGAAINGSLFEMRAALNGKN